MDVTRDDDTEQFDAPRRILICNPTSGSEDHVDSVTKLAREHDFETVTTSGEGDAWRLARRGARAGASLIAAAGGDGTVNEVVNGIYDADALENTTLAVVPVGTGNNFAMNIGVTGIEAAFELIETANRRRIDLGVATDRAFVNSCIGGVTAEASGATGSDQKRALGVLAYLRQTVEIATSFEPLPLRVDLGSATNGVNGGILESETEKSAGNAGCDEETWMGQATFVLVGNCRRFSGVRGGQAHVEDGRFEVTIVGGSTAIDLIRATAFDALLERSSDHVVRTRTPSLTVESLDGAPIEYSLDGEILETDHLHLETKPNAIQVVVGEAYRTNPDEKTSRRNVNS